MASQAAAAANYCNIPSQQTHFSFSEEKISFLTAGPGRLDIQMPLSLACNLDLNFRATLSWAPEEHWYSRHHSFYRVCSAILRISWVKFWSCCTSSYDDSDINLILLSPLKVSEGLKKLRNLGHKRKCVAYQFGPLLLQKIEGCILYFFSSLLLSSRRA